MLNVLIMSSDGYEDCWKPFSILYNKYFPNNYKTYIVTATKICPYFDTIKKTGTAPDIYAPSDMFRTFAPLFATAHF